MLISAEPDPLKAPLEQQTLILNSDTSCVYRQKLLELCKASPLHNPAMMEFDSLESILQAVSGGLGISVIPADLAGSRKEAYPFQLTELPGTVRVDFLIRPGRAQPPALKKFIRFLQENKSGRDR
ncbi:HTH-type transcriptional regulator YofA [compost metagenome]